MPEENQVPVDEQVDIVVSTDDSVTKNLSEDSELSESRSKFSKFVDFVKKHKIVFLVGLVVFIIACVLYVFIPIISLGNTYLVNANTVVKIKDGQMARLKISNVSVKVTHFTNDACPQGKTCFGTGTKAVEYQMIIDGKKYATGSQNPAENTNYKVETVSTDYKTYAEIKIIKSK